MKTNVELIVPIGSVVIAMFFWLLIVFVIRGRKKVRMEFSCHLFPFPGFFHGSYTLVIKRCVIHSVWACMTD